MVAQCAIPGWEVKEPDLNWDRLQIYKTFAKEYNAFQFYLFNQGDACISECVTQQTSSNVCKSF